MQSIVLVQVFEEKQGMETITSPTCLWVVRKNLTSIMKVVVGCFLWALVVLVGSSQVWELFSLMCFGFWLEISDEKRQPSRNHK